MDKTEIRKATAADIPLIIELTMQVWPQTYTPILGSEQVTYMLDRFYAPGRLKEQMEEAGHRFIICFVNERPVAFASWSEVEERAYKLHKLYILPGQQGMGVGRRMVNYIVDEIKRENATMLMLNVNRFNYSAQAFYEKTGFKQLKEEDIDIGNGYFMNDYVLGLLV